MKVKVTQVKFYLCSLCGKSTSSVAITEFGDPVCADCFLRRTAQVERENVNLKSELFGVRTQLASAIELNVTYSSMIEELQKEKAELLVLASKRIVAPPPVMPSDLTHWLAECGGDISPANRKYFKQIDTRLKNKEARV